MSATHSHFPSHSPTNSQFLLCCALHIVLTSRALMHYVGGVDSITPRTATMFRCTERHMHHWYQDTHPWHVTTQSPSLFLSKNRLLLDGQLQLHFAHPARNSDVFTYRFITHPHKYVISVHSTSHIPAHSQLTHSISLHKLPPITLALLQCVGEVGRRIITNSPMQSARPEDIHFSANGQSTTCLPYLR